MNQDQPGATAGEAASGAFRVKSLTGLEHASAVAGKVVWDAPRSLWNIAMLGAALAFAPSTFALDSLAVFFAIAGVTLCAGHSVGFHRRLIHRSFDCPKWVEYVLVYLGTLVGMGGPIWTVRLHDTRDWAQRQPDCHWFLRHGLPMPLEGLTYLNLKLVLAHPPGFDPGPDITGDRFYRFLQSTWMAQQLPLAALLFALGGWPWVIWGIFVRVSVCTTMHWMISYLAHTGSPDDWAVDDAAIQARNVGWMAIPTMGEAWHGNHHAFPSSARHGLYPGQIDLGWWFVQALATAGLATNIKTPATLPHRSGLSPLTSRATSVAPAQVEAA
jgi:stearoyl-CoA desaturase (delta-9 desaturase)